MPKKKNTKKKQKQGPKKPQRKMMSNGNRGMGLTRSICALTDPFCYHSTGAKYPDDTSVPTFTERLVSYISLTNDAAGRGAIVFLPNPLYNYAICTMTGATATIPVVYSGTITQPAFTSYYQNTQYRIVSWGVKVFVSGNSQQSQGLVTVATIGGIGVNDTFFIGSNNWSECSVGPATTGKEWAAISKPTSIQARQFCSKWNNTEYQPGWQPIVVSINGGTPSVNTISFEITMNIEWYLDFSTTTGASSADVGLMKLATPSPPSNPILQSLASRVTTGVRGIIDSGVKSATNMIERYASSLASKAISGAAGYLLGPMGGVGANMIMNVD